MAEMMTRLYSNLAGCDFSSDVAKVALNRSPNCVNMYKDYTTVDDEQCVQTRPGFRYLTKLFTYHGGHSTTPDNILSMFLFVKNNVKKLVIHAGNYLKVWNNFSTNPGDTPFVTVLYTNMSTINPASFVVFEDKLYINDGSNYLVYDGSTISPVSDNAFVPTTTISRLPSGGGVLYQAVNVLTPKRKNSFVADGTSTQFNLDTDLIDNASVRVFIDGVEIATTEYSVNYVSGYITFNTAPSVPLTEGQDNVVIEFEKAGSGYSDRIPNCTRNIVFDNRIFFTGNNSFKNAIFHCELNDPTYISDLAYYQDGTTDSAIKDFTVGNNLLWVFKEASQQNDTIFYHEPTIDTEYGKIYPSKQGNISAGCVSKCINFNDDIVFFSNLGLEGITGNIDQEQLISHRSTLIDSKFINESNYKDLKVVEWNGYLVCLVNNKLYLADSRQVWRGNRGYEYEWYYWLLSEEFLEYSDNINTLLSVNNELFIGTKKGAICVLDVDFIYDSVRDNSSPLGGNITIPLPGTESGTNESHIVNCNIYSCWQTPYDIFGDTNNLKTTNKRGGVAKIKTIQNGKIKVSVQTNRKDEKFIKEYSATGFDFNNIDFSNFAFTTKSLSYIVYKIKMKKFIDLTLKFYSDKEPFGLYDATLEVYKGSYIKRT